MAATPPRPLVASPRHVATTFHDGSEIIGDSSVQQQADGHYSFDEDDSFRIAKKRRIGSFNPENDENDENDAITSLPQLLEASQDETIDSIDTFDNVARIARAFEIAGPGLPQSPFESHTPLPESHSQLTESNGLISPSKPPTGLKAQGFTKASRMKLDSLPILDNLATQILTTIAKSSYQEMVNLLSQPDSEAGHEYGAVLDLFSHTKRVYSTNTPFLSAVDLDLTDSTQVDTVRKANVATFVSSLFGSLDISLIDMDTYFLEVFVPEGGKLLKAHGSLLLDLKTQAVVHSLSKDRASNDDLLDRLFPTEIEPRILARRPGARGLAPSEQDFVKRVMSRREILLRDIHTPEGLAVLPGKYHWHDFLRDVVLYVGKNLENITAPTVKKVVKETSQPPDTQSHTLSQTQLENNFQVMPVKPAAPEVRTEQPKDDDFVAKAARAAQIALQGHGLSMSPPPFEQTPLQASPTPQQQFQEMPAFQQYQPPGSDGEQRASGSPRYGPDVPHASQSAPTQVLYERARMVASAKAIPAPRKAGTPSQRRPWTTEEENTLMTGLDRVRGPHWSQILAMYGPGGTINENLKDRNQVQLKDKARNLKLFFLKSGIEVPYYLKYVTGDLKTRAPGQASKNEARERDRQRGDEDRAHYDGVQGIMALAGGSTSGYSEAVSTGSSLPESAQAAYDRVMNAIGSRQLSEQPLDPSLASHVDVLSPLQGSDFVSPPPPHLQPSPEPEDIHAQN